MTKFKIGDLVKTTDIDGMWCDEAQRKLGKVVNIAPNGTLTVELLEDEVSLVGYPPLRKGYRWRKSPDYFDRCSSFECKSLL